MNPVLRQTVAAVVAALAVSAAHAVTETRISPTGGTLPNAVTEVGGIVLDLTGTNGVRVVTQLAASTLFVGSPSAANNPTLIGTQSGFSAGVLGALGGGLAAASVRVSLFDGDSAPGNFDFNNNTLLLDGSSIGNFSAVPTVQTNSTGTTLINSTNGFGNNILSTGFFSSSDATFLSGLFASLADGSLAYAVNDSDPGDQFYDFTQGLDGGLVDIGTGPVVVPPVNAIPEPETYALMLAGLGFLGAVARRRRARKSA
jgi:hypothetical protein